jgi:SUZ-C motif
LSREEPEAFHLLASRDNVPLKSEYKPALRVLSRKPAPKAVQRVDPVTGLAKMTLEDEDEEEEQQKDQPSPEELRLRAQREREEKQRRYDEARARILGTPSGTSSPGTTTPPTEESKPNRNRGRGRGNGRQQDQRPASQSGNKELFDPNYTPKPGVTIQKRNGEASRSGQSAPRDEDQIIRTPRGPDGFSKGFGFANRGGKAT